LTSGLTFIPTAVAELRRVLEEIQAVRGILSRARHRPGQGDSTGCIRGAAEGEAGMTYTSWDAVRRLVASALA
jgi:hypothetical protein